MALALACDPGSEGESTGAETADTGGELASFSLWQGSEQPQMVVSGGPLAVELGSQALYMFALPVVGQGFVLPEDPRNFIDPKAPRITAYVDIPGHATANDGHFARVLDFPLRFSVSADGTATSDYVALVIPLSLAEIQALEGVRGTLYAELATWEHGLHAGAETGNDLPLVFRAEIVVAAPPMAH